MPKNLTLSIDKDLLDKARVLAAVRRTSVNEMVRGFLAREVAREQEDHAATEALVRLTRESAARGGDGRSSPRDETQSGEPRFEGWRGPNSESHSALANVIRLAEKLGQFDDRWSPKTVATYNGNDVMVVKIEGEFNWHKHDDTDDLFHVLAGQLEIDIEGEETRTLFPGDLMIVPKGKLHRPRTVNGVVHMLLIEPAETPNTGDAETAAPRQFL